MNGLPSALHVADYMLATAKLYFGLDLDQLQLNKMLYLTNGFVLQRHSEPAFHNNIEAWKYGPVVRVVYETYQHWGNNPIKMLDLCRTSLDDIDKVKERWLDLFSIVGTKVAEIVGGVLAEYGTCTGGELVDMTHRRGTPWDKTYRPGFNNIISTESIANFYRNIDEQNAR